MSEMGDRAYSKLQRVINEGGEKVSGILNSIQREYDVRKDFIARPNNIFYNVEGGNVKPVINGQEYTLTNHAENQMYGRLQMPQRYADKLLEIGEDRLLLHNLNRLTTVNAGEGVFFREVNGTIKGWLSPSYRRMDATPIFEAFIVSMMENKFVPLEGFNTDYRYQLRFIRPEVSEVAKDEYVVYGSSITTGDYGDAALSIEDFIMRIICSNMAIGFDAFRKIHIGKRFDNEQILSRETHDLDTKAIASAVNDVAKGSFDRTKYLHKAITEGMEKEVNLNATLNTLSKKGVSKKILNDVKTMYEADVITELLPPQKTTWRLSNAISLIAQSATPDMRIDLEKEAFNVLTG